MPRHSYKQAFIKSSKLEFRLIEVVRISDGVALLKALGDGSLLVSTRKRRVGEGYFNMAECPVRELVGKTESEIFDMLDQRMDKVLESERQKIAGKRP